MVLFLHLLHLLKHHLVIGEVALLFRLVLAGDVGLAQDHQRVDVVPRVEEQAAHGAVRHDVLGERDGAQVQQHEVFHEAHLVIQR